MVVGKRGAWTLPLETAARLERNFLYKTVSIPTAFVASPNDTDGMTRWSLVRWCGSRYCCPDDHYLSLKELIPGMCIGRDAMILFCVQQRVWDGLLANERTKTKKHGRQEDYPTKDKVNFYT
eukprot:scaffold6611_cov150-Amphora_coffeaeformis.AAC.3